MRTKHTARFLVFFGILLLGGCQMGQPIDHLSTDSKPSSEAFIELIPVEAQALEPFHRVQTQSLETFLEQKQYVSDDTFSFLYRAPNRDASDLENVITLFETNELLVRFFEEQGLRLVITDTYPNRLLSEFELANGRDGDVGDYAAGIYDRQERVLYVMQGYQHVPLGTFWHEVGHALLDTLSFGSTLTEAYDLSVQTVTLSAYYLSTEEEFFAELFSLIQQERLTVESLPSEAQAILQPMVNAFTN